MYTVVVITSQHITDTVTMDIRLVCVVAIGMCCFLPSLRGVHKSGSSQVRSLRQASDNNNFLEYTERFNSAVTNEKSKANKIKPNNNKIINSNGWLMTERNGTDNRKPALQNCKNEALRVKEEQPPNIFVVRVEADDPDELDTIDYSLVNSITERTRFRINSNTGDIYTSYTFDRDEPIREKEVSSYTF